MKTQILKDFDKFLLKLNIGYQTDYSNILHKISFIQTYQALDKIDPIYEFLMSN